MQAHDYSEILLLTPPAAGRLLPIAILTHSLPHSHTFQYAIKYILFISITKLYMREYQVMMLQHAHHV
jgi:hypothetical protein